MPAYLSPIGNTQTVDNNGEPLVGGWFEVYLAGTTTPTTTWTDSSGLIAQPAQITLDASGRTTNPIWLTGGQPVKIRLFNSFGSILETWDDISGIGDPGGSTQDQWVLYGGSPTYLTATSFSVPGDQTGVFQAGRAVKTINAGGTVYGVVQSSVFTTVTTITLGTSGTLDAGLSAVSHGLISSLTTSLPALGIVELKAYFGGVGNGSTDDTDAIAAAVAYLGARGGGVLDLSLGRWLINSADITLPQGVKLMGQWRTPGEQPSINYSTLQGAIILNPSYTIRMQKGSSIEGMAIMKSGLTVPTDLASAGTLVASFAGKAITIGTGSATTAEYSDTYVGYCLFLGFQYAYYLSYAERPRVEYIAGDCLNGIYIDQCYDMNHVSHCHFWPFLTAHQSWTLSGPAGYRRSGVAYQFGSSAGPADWAQADNCFQYGYTTGFLIQNSSNSVMTNCGSDNHAAGGDTTTTGFLINGTSADAKLIGCKAAAQGRGFVIDLNSTPFAGNTASLIGCQAWGTLTDHVLVNSGHGTIIGSTLRGAVTGAGVNVVSTSLGAVIDGNTFDSVTTPMIATGAGLLDSQIGINRFYNCVDATIGNRTLKDNQLAESYWAKYSADAGPYTHIGRKSRGTVASPTIVQTGDGVLQRLAQGWDGAAFRNVGYDQWQLSGTVGAGATPGTWLLATSPTASTTPVQRLAVNHDGNFFPISDNAYTCGANGLRWSAVWAANGTIQTSNAADKTDIRDSELGLNFINTLRPVSFKWKVGGKRIVRQRYFKDGKELPEGADISEAVAGGVITEDVPGRRTHYGFLAQDVHAAIPQGKDFGGWVKVDLDDPDSEEAIRPDQFIAPLVKAVQELSAQLDALKNQ